MWIRTVHGRDELVSNPLHIKLFLEEGGYEIDDPTTQKQEEAPQPPEQGIEPPDGSEPDGSDGQEQTGLENAPVDPGKPSEPDSGKGKRKSSISEK